MKNATFEQTREQLIFTKEKNKVEKVDQKERKFLLGSFSTFLIGTVAALFLYFFPTTFIIPIGEMGVGGLHEDMNLVFAWAAIFYVGFNAIVLFVNHFLLSRNGKDNIRFNLFLRNVSLTIMSVSILVPAFLVSMAVAIPTLFNVDVSSKIAIIGYGIIFGLIAISIVTNFFSFLSSHSKSRDTLNKNSYKHIVTNLIAVGSFGSIIMLAIFGGMSWGLGVHVDLSTGNIDPIYGTGFMGTVLGNWQGILLFIGSCAFVLTNVIIWIRTFIFRTFAVLDGSKTQFNILKSAVTLVMVFVSLYVVEHLMLPEYKDIVANVNINPNGGLDIVVIGNPYYFFSMFTITVVAIGMPLLNIVLASIKRYNPTQRLDKAVEKDNKKIITN